MKVIIPLAGFGTRLRPHTYSKPKPLVNVAGKPVLGHILDKLVDLPLEEVIFIVGYLGEQIKEYVEANYHFPARFIEQKELLGQAHAIWLARDHVPGEVLIIFVDTIFETDLDRVLNADADGVLLVKEVEDPRRFGVVVLEDGYVRRLVEKPDSDEYRLAVIGVYFIKDGPRLMQAIDQLMARRIQTKGEYYLADALQIMIDEGARLVAQEVDVWEDCGKPETVLHTNRYLLSKQQGDGREAHLVNSAIIPPVYIAASAHIENSIIGPYATIAEHARICNAHIRDSIIDEGAVICDTMLDQSLIGKNAVVRGRFRRLNVGDSSQVDFSDGD
ncbi:MAG: sugar phosphate nucleotidyltransferase [Anaerolineae bacterium]